MAKQKVLRNVNSAHTCVLDQINWMRKKKKKRKKIPHSLTRFACVRVCSRECVQLWLADCLQWNVSCPHHMTRCAAVMCVRTYLCVCVIKCVCVSALHSQECVRVTGRQTDGRRAKERQQGAGKSIDNVTSFLILHWHCDTLRCCVCSAGSLPSRVRVQKIQDVKSVPQILTPSDWMTLFQKCA